MSYIQEPTSGLDSSNACNLLTTLKNIAVTRNKTIVASIHQPSSHVFFMFDKLLLLCNGQVSSCLCRGKRSALSVVHWARANAVNRKTRSCVFLFHFIHFIPFYFFVTVIVIIIVITIVIVIADVIVIVIVTIIVTVIVIFF